MKILMITPYLPYPLVSGGQIRSYNLIKNLAQHHQITLISFIRDQQELEYLPELDRYCSKVITFKRTNTAWHVRNILHAGFSMYPFVVSLYYYPSLRRMIQQELTEQTYDLIHAETFYVMPNIPCPAPAPILLVEQVIEYLVYQQYTNRLSGWKRVLRPLLSLDVAKIKRWEKYYWNYADGLAAMSEDDKAFMHSIVPDLQIDVIANGVDIDFFTDYQPIKHQRPTILFVGNFKWLPNREAVKYLVEQVWPLIIKQLPQAKLLIVGRYPTKEIAHYGQTKGVEVLGEIDDIRQAFYQSDVLLAPILNGRGTKYKILESMATRTPVVGTKLAVEGLDVRHGYHALIAESADQLAANTVKLVKQPDYARQMADHAFDLVSHNYSWQNISEELNQVYHRLVDQT